MTEKFIPAVKNPPAKVKDAGLVKMAMDGACVYNAKSGEIILLPKGMELKHGAAARLKAESHLADFPALLENTLIRNGIMQSQHFKTISSYWENLDVALVGIGSPAIRDGANWHAFYGSEESDDLNARHVAGDICSRFYDINGIAVETNMNEKTLSIDIARLKQVRYSVGIAIGEEKYTGIIGALRGGYINCLVTNRETAERLLK